jgi:hypothetical protein
MKLDTGPVKKDGAMPSKTQKRKTPLDMDDLFSMAMPQSAMGAYYLLPLKRQLLIETPALLHTRVKKLMEKIENEPDSVLARVVKMSFGQATGSETILAASIAHNNYEAVAEQLAGAIEGKEFGKENQLLGFLKGEAFLSYFMKNTKDDNQVRLPKQTIPMLAEQFGKEFEAISKSLEKRLPDKEDRYFFIEKTYGKNYVNGKDIQTLIEDNLKRHEDNLKRHAAKA